MEVMEFERQSITVDGPVVNYNTCAASTDVSVVNKLDRRRVMMRIRSICRGKIV